MPPTETCGMASTSTKFKDGKDDELVTCGNIPFCGPVSKAQLYEAIKSVKTQEQNLPS